MRKCFPPLLLIKKKKIKKPHCNFGIFLAQQFSLSQVLILYMGPWKQLKLYNFGKRQKMNIYLSSSLFSQWRIHNRPLHRYRNCNNLLKRVQTSCPFFAVTYTCATSIPCFSSSSSSSWKQITMAISDHSYT